MLSIMMAGKFGRALCFVSPACVQGDLHWPMSRSTGEWAAGGMAAMIGWVKSGGRGYGIASLAERDGWFGWPLWDAVAGIKCTSDRAGLAPVNISGEDCILFCILLLL